MLREKADHPSRGQATMREFAVYLRRILKIDLTAAAAFWDEGAKEASLNGPVARGTG